MSLILIIVLESNKISKIVQRGISAYKVGCDNAKEPHREDANDASLQAYDFSNDVIARTKFFEENLFT